MSDREQKIKSLKVRLRLRKEAAQALNNELWGRSHEAIYAKDRVVAVAEPNLLKNIGYRDYDVSLAAQTTRHITGCCPKYIADLVDRIYDLYPELKEEE